MKTFKKETQDKRPEFSGHNIYPPISFSKTKEPKRKRKRKICHILVNSDSG